MATFIELVEIHYRKLKDLRAAEQARAVIVQEHGQIVAAKQAEATTAEKAIFDSLK